jgi:glycosyltransferase involved in cell wall biosynthesis
MRRKFVVDTENVGTFVTNWNFKDLLSPMVRKQIEDGIRSKYCRKIMPLTQAALRTMEATLDLEGVREKIEVLYPAIKVDENRKNSHGNIRILFVGNNFFIKGGRELVSAFKVLKRKYDVELLIVSEEAHSRNLPTQAGVTVYPSLPRKQLLAEFYPNVDIFCVPTYADSFGFVFLEAKAASLPIVTTNHFHMSEIVEEWKTGLMIESPISCWKKDYTYDFEWQNKLTDPFPKSVAELVEKLSILIEDRPLRESMGDCGREEVETGKFSVGVRNQKLSEIYQEALYS